MKTLVLVTKLVDSFPQDFARIVLSFASEIVFMQNGVYNTAAKMEERGILQSDDSVWRALDVDIEARRVTSEFELVSYADIIDAVERNDKVITL